MDILRYTETDFYFQQREADRRWWLAFSLALCVHGAVVLVAMFMPSLFAIEPIVEEVVSVSLVAMPDAGGAVAPSAPAAASPSKPSVEKEAPPPPPHRRRRNRPPRQNLWRRPNRLHRRRRRKRSLSSPKPLPLNPLN